MSKSHGMGPIEYARFLFDQEFAARSPKEKRDFLISTIDDFTNKAIYASHQNPLSHQDANTAIYAGELFLEVAKEIGKPLTDQEKYRFSKLLEVLDGIKFDDGELDTKKLKNLFDEVVKLNLENSGNDVKPESQMKTTRPNTPSSVLEIDPEVIQINTIAGSNFPDEDIKIFVSLLPLVQDDDDLTKELKDEIRIRFERGIKKDPRDSIKRLCAIHGVPDKYDEILKSFNRITAKCIDDLAKLIKNPSAFIDDPKAQIHLRNVAVDKLGLFLDNISETKYPSHLILGKANFARRFFASEDFTKVCRSQSAKFLYVDRKIDRKPLRRYMTIGHTYGNEDVVFLAAVTHVAHGEKFGEPMGKIDSQIRFKVTPRALNSVSKWLLPIRIAPNDAKTWLEVARNTVAYLGTSRQNPSR